MQRSPLVPIVGFGLVGLALLVAVVLTSSFLGNPTGSDGTPTGSGDTGAPASGAPASPGATGATQSATPSPTPLPTDPPLATPDPGADPQLAFAEFVLRLGTAREDADRLMDELQLAAEAGDDAGVRAAALDIGDLVDEERAWLAAHPPAPCYADAHRDADGMYVAFGVAADRAVAWADADGLAAIPALIDALDAVSRAVEDAQDLTAALGRVDCG
ncbi:MAG TPA: hypothetical protein VLA23_06855 [Candidatus Limnocylindrales bacterium]|nr:hypothetical protein [Candidatus Limnocylindrales bacterium]